MKKKLAFLAVLIGLFVNAQSNWSLTGNSGTNPGTGWNNGVVNFLGTTDSQDLVFKTNNLERMRIDSNGRIGIPYIYPGYNTTVSGRTIFIIDEDEDYFRVHNSPQVYNPLRIDGANMITFLEEDTNNGGRVVIGSTTLANCSDCNQYKLFVKNGIRTEKVKVDIAASNGWADYVFKKDYKLMPLKEVEHFITNNGHLPEVPSTEEAIKNGIELKEMNILLLKKIEELTLYTIEQQKRIEALEKK